MRVSHGVKALRTKVLAATFCAAAWATPASAGNLFANFAGDWAGSGQIVLVGWVARGHPLQGVLFDEPER